jgi:hypothetical protein
MQRCRLSLIRKTAHPHRQKERLFTSLGSSNRIPPGQQTLSGMLALARWYTAFTVNALQSRGMRREVASPAHNGAKENGTLWCGLRHPSRTHCKNWGSQQFKATSPASTGNCKCSRLPTNVERRRPRITDRLCVHERRPSPPTECLHNRVEIKIFFKKRMMERWWTSERRASPDSTKTEGHGVPNAYDAMIWRVIVKTVKGTTRFREQGLLQGQALHGGTAFSNE